MNHRAKVCPPSRTSTGPGQASSWVCPCSAANRWPEHGAPLQPCEPRELTRTVRTRRARAAPAALSARGTAPLHPTRLRGPFPPPKLLFSRLPMGVWGAVAPQPLARLLHPSPFTLPAPQRRCLGHQQSQLAGLLAARCPPCGNTTQLHVPHVPVPRVHPAHKPFALCAKCSFSRAGPSAPGAKMGPGAPGPPWAPSPCPAQPLPALTCSRFQIAFQ